MHCSVVSEQTGYPRRETRARRGDHFPKADPEKEKTLKTPGNDSPCATQLNLKNLQADRPKRLLL
jgi:hypothetical protein